MYKCEGCDAEFAGTPEQAFDLGWDTPERFMSHCTCPTCSITVTAWWRIVMLHEQPTLADIMLLSSYNQLYSEYNEVGLNDAHS